MGRQEVGDNLTMGRQAIYHDDAVIAINTREARHKIQPDGDRRAVLNFLLDQGGKATLKQVNDHFGFDMSSRVVALARNNWIEVTK
jgi:hypothetical protein